MAENTSKSPINVGARAIYEMRAHPKKAPWDKVVLETRNAYRTRMVEVLNALAAAGFEVRKAGQRHQSLGSAMSPFASLSRSTTTDLPATVGR